MTIQVRRVRADEWRQVRDLRLQALQDPLAHLAFLETYEDRAVSPDEFWQERAAGAADGHNVSQWVAEVGGQWIGTVVVIVFRAGDIDYYGERVAEPRASLVGVYLLPGHRGLGVLESLIDTAAVWSVQQGFEALHLDVHPDNTPAIKAYVRCGFGDTGERPECDGVGDVRMLRSLA